MAKNNKTRDKVNIAQSAKTTQNGKNAKKPIIHPKYKSLFNTIIFIIILIIFFIVNNTRKEPESGPYPPFYNAGQTK